MDTRINFTKPALDALPLPEAGKRATYYDADGHNSVRGLQLRVTANGVKTFNVFKRVSNGEPERVSLGRYPDISIEQARKGAMEIIARLAHGDSPNAEKRTKRVYSLTFKEALEDYAEKKRRTKDNLPLKVRTRADYLAMVAPGKEKADGTLGAAGELFALADKPLRDISAEDIHRVHKKAMARGERRAAYAMQVLRAVLNWHGITVPGNPLGKGTAGKDRITIPQARPAELVIPPERVGEWWRAAQALPPSVAADYLQFLLLTGCRPAEPLTILVSDCDLTGKRVVLRDTKNRTDHVLLLSRQAAAIVTRHAKGKKAEDRLFPISDPRKTVQALTEASGIAFSPKYLRATFASVAEERVTAYTLKRMMNHAMAGDVTGIHYVQKSADQLRAGWQAVADHIEAMAGANVIALPGVAA